MTQVYERERELQHEVERRLANETPDVEVLAVELLGPDRFCVYIEHADGVDHALCGRVTDLLREYSDRYTIDVSSPGIERPLRSREHFADAEGRRASVRVAFALDGRKRFRGRINHAGADVVTLGVEDDEVAIPYDAIVRANLIDEGR